ncbi:MAG: HU family DNA-binding protein [Balneolaceae bacterium]
MSTKITLNRLIEELSDEAEISKAKSQEFINSLIETTLDDVNSKGKAAITNFGSFTIVEVAERTGVNPKTGEPLVIPAHKRISFTPYKALEKKVNSDYDHLEAQVVDSDQQSTSTQEVELERPKNEAERLLDALISEEKKEEVQDVATPENEPFDDDPFDLGDEEQEEEESPEVEAETLEALNEELLDELDEPEADRPTETKAFRTPGRPERKSNSVSPTVLLSVIAVFLLAVLAIWFFYLRSDTAPITASTNTDDILNDPSAFENEQVLNEISDANQESVNSSPDDPDSQIIPMVAPEVDLTENPGEMMTIENQEPQIEYEQFTAINYNVSAGVWIYEIARQTYGNTRLWPLIFQANYTLANNPDLILPNIVLNIPQLEGSTERPTGADYLRLAEAARYVAQAYENAGNSEQAASYLKAADWYETMQ